MNPLFLGLNPYWTVSIFPSTLESFTNAANKYVTRNKTIERYKK